MSVTYPDLSYTTYPDSFQNFVPMLNITAADASLIQQYQTAIQSQNLTLAQSILSQIPQYAQKIVTSIKLNTAFDTTVALERYFSTKYSPAYIVSATEPPSQETGDYWFDTSI